MTFEELTAITQTPLDCACEGHGVVLSTRSPCASHFLFGTSEDFRLESLRLTYANLQAFVLYHTSTLEESHLPKTEKEVQEVVRAIYNPQTPSEWVLGIKKYILCVLSYFICFEEEREEQVCQLLNLEGLIGSL